MSLGPNIVSISALIGDPARARMLGALMNGTALTAGELAREANVSASTASAHLAQLQGGGLVHVAHQGRHRYYRLAGPEVAHLIETLYTVAAPRSRSHGPRDPALRKLRVCYDHLAGAEAIALVDRWIAAGWLTADPPFSLTEDGRRAFAAAGLDMAALERQRRPLCRACLDWSERRPHLAGALGAAILEHALILGWVRRLDGTRTLMLTPIGQRALACFPAPAPDRVPAPAVRRTAVRRTAVCD